MKAYDLAHIVTHYVNEKGDQVSHKKLQKLLYYIEAWYLVYFGKPLLDENFEAWVHGPVIPELYDKLKRYGFNNLKIVNDEYDTVDEEVNAIIEKNKLTKKEIELIYAVLDKYGGISSFDLELLTHSEPPWIEARKGFAPHQRCKVVIDKNKMKEYYSSLING